MGINVSGESVAHPFSKRIIARQPVRIWHSLRHPRVDATIQFSKSGIGNTQNSQTSHIPVPETVSLPLIYETRPALARRTPGELARPLRREPKSACMTMLAAGYSELVGDVASDPSASLALLYVGCNGTLGVHQPFGDCFPAWVTWVHLETM